VRMELTRANAGDALRLVGPDDRLLGVLAIDAGGGQITAMFNQINPDKLRHLGEVGDGWALLRDAR
jgi:hypothetical protein